MNSIVADVAHQYLYLYADCFPVKGHTRTALYDISRKHSYFFDNCFYELLQELKDKSIGEVAAMLPAAEDVAEFEKFIQYLQQQELATIVDDLSVFPPMSLEWDHPSEITNALIDVREKMHNFQQLFEELETLNCQHIQIRSYRPLSVDEVTDVLSHTTGKGFNSVQIMMPFTDGETSNALATVIKTYSIGYLIFHSVPAGLLEESRSQCNPEEIMFTDQVIDSCHACGIINQKSLSLLPLSGFIENIRFNGCLNRKIAVDENGRIKNCPSFDNHYGYAGEVSLTAVAAREAFRQRWYINKDTIRVCKDCEFRYICTDCRAYTTESHDEYAKPAKCKYDPYTGVWAE
ncbi:grasp-with-spasm system SPASM domain peptide maturase [Chitinophaga nivalis]|uniref:Grasp-with-spasm system SPASM domain peptide maturase n=1 Tax=Chitinophaga nivalis TaxID=2991709 RepID=A0ABT3IKS8_9BACT|nr:grasp-with-spasm system SPASM domain peptide maturase [Chitinophaga nivalis]MCW3465788.1 grasp-with-spasm system SPASM domain peptide maturase [Chitinophaga nivalis]MCW3484521.1 grasp-with-spasm system SPASM domain peptide maturase [Chitinophaga nivalis]